MVSGRGGRGLESLGRGPGRTHLALLGDSLVVLAERRAAVPLRRVRRQHVLDRVVSADPAELRRVVELLGLEGVGGPLRALREALGGRVREARMGWARAARTCSEFMITSKSLIGTPSSLGSSFLSTWSDGGPGQPACGDRTTGRGRATHIGDQLALRRHRQARIGPTQVPQRVIFARVRDGVYQRRGQVGLGDRVASRAPARVAGPTRLPVGGRGPGLQRGCRGCIRMGDLPPPRSK